MFKHKTVLITGSTSGIGWGLAQGFAQAGYGNIVLNGFANSETIADQCATLENMGAQTLYYAADMREVEQVADMMQAAQERFGAVDVLVNNAGIQYVAAVQDFPPEQWQDILNINLSSAHGLVASPFKSAYVAAKHGLVGFTKAVALEVAEQNITCNALCPGYVCTPLVEAQIPATARERNITTQEVICDVMLKNQATKKFVRIAEITDTALYLCSDSACSITGTALSIDGGWLAQ